GVNGTGKSTLLKLVAGLEEPDSGPIVRGRNLAIRYLSQNPVFEKGETVLESIIRENDGHDHVWDFESQAKSMLNKLGITNHHEVVDHLSGGQKKRVALASVLLSTADLLILDEPTNHLDSEMAEWLEEYLKKFRGALLMITHDRYFLDSVTNCIVELDNGKLYRYQANYEGFLELKAERMDMERASERKRQSILRVELEWVKRGARARTTKQKGRLQRYEDLKNQKGPTEELSVEMESVSSRLGRTTVELSDICKAYGDKVLIKDYTYFFLKNDRIGYIGPNGSGKSTLMKIIAGWEKPDSGTIDIGQTVKMGYFSQENEDMDTSLKVIDYIKNVAEYVKTKDGSISASQMLERFLFPPSVQYTVIGKLSGGERRRLYLLKILMDAPNVLILDEPTNDLDIKTLMILEDYLDSFQGIVITVSHDRYFLDRVVRRIFAFEGDGVIRQYEGGFTDYQIKKEAEMAALGETAGSGAGAKGGKAAAAANAAEPAKKTEKPREKKLKFTYMEQREWDTIEDDMAALEDKIADLDAQIAASATNYGKLRELMAAKEETEAKLEEKMERWMYLNDLAEKIAEQNK
ncbi:MAG: ABC-F family ATP-binding cassette domain-containing protein, partial [Lachnospiraceae bacterium]|nr:ABC-F family ATP-binding cassette domain-containing protein [Lachnospiraceae bacterium]